MNKKAQITAILPFLGWEVLAVIAFFVIVVLVFVPWMFSFINWTPVIGLLTAVVGLYLVARFKDKVTRILGVLFVLVGVLLVSGAIPGLYIAG